MFKPDNIWNMYLDEFEFWAEGVLFHIGKPDDE
jgi:hypothetical protein